MIFLLKNLYYKNNVSVEGTPEVQQITLLNSATIQAPFVLNFQGVDTSKPHSILFLMFIKVSFAKLHPLVVLAFESTASSIRNALNDLPTLSPDLVEEVLLNTTNSGDIVIQVKFSPRLGKTCTFSCLFSR